MRTVYLAGGMRGVDWQAEVAKRLHGWIIFDPRECKSTDPHVYTEWDLNHIDKARVVLAYMETGNPSGFGMSWEMGYARAKNKHVVFVDALGDDKRSKYFDMHRVTSYTFKTLDEAADYLRRWASSTGDERE